MASSSSVDKDLVKCDEKKDFAESEIILNLLHKICAQDISPAQKTVRTLPLMCKLLTTDIDLKGTVIK